MREMTSSIPSKYATRVPDIVSYELILRAVYFTVKYSFLYNKINSFISNNLFYDYFQGLVSEQNHSATWIHLRQVKQVRNSVSWLL